VQELTTLLLLVRLLATKAYLQKITDEFRAQISSSLLGIIYGKKPEPTPRKEHKVNTPYSTSHFRD
jgi:hypothetical protein